VPVGTVFGALGYTSPHFQIAIRIVRIGDRHCDPSVALQVFVLLAAPGRAAAQIAEINPAPRAQRYLAPSTATGISVE
jgi:hypothetical protein